MPFPFVHCGRQPGGAGCPAVPAVPEALVADADGTMAAVR